LDRFGLPNCFVSGLLLFFGFFGDCGLKAAKYEAEDVPSWANSPAMSFSIIIRRPDYREQNPAGRIEHCYA